MSPIDNSYRKHIFSLPTSQRVLPTLYILNQVSFRKVKMPDSRLETCRDVKEGQGETEGNFDNPNKE